MENTGKASLESVRALAAAFQIDAKELFPQPKQQEREPSGIDSSKHFLVRLFSGRELFDIFVGAHAFSCDNDDLRTQEEVEIVGNFLQNIRDYADIWEDVELTQRTQLSFEYTGEIEQLNRAGFWVFGSRLRSKVRVAGQVIDDWQIGAVRVVRTDNPTIMRVATKNETLPYFSNT